MEIKFLEMIEKDRGLLNDLLDAIKELNISPNLEISGNISDFIKYGVRAPNAVVINGKVVYKGQYSFGDKIKKILREEAKKEGLI